MKTERFDKKLFKQEVLNNLKTQFRVGKNYCDSVVMTWVAI